MTATAARLTQRESTRYAAELERLGYRVERVLVDSRAYLIEVRTYGRPVRPCVTLRTADEVAAMLARLGEN